MLEYGVERRVSTHSTLGATMIIGVPVGVTLRVKLIRASQTYTFPIHLSDEILTQPIFYGTVTPLVVWCKLNKFSLFSLAELFKYQKTFARREVINKNMTHMEVGRAQA
jgi:DnaJ family protein C protein 11